jgi:NDP-sugar pyrophosphorylase family protein
LQIKEKIKNDFIILNADLITEFDYRYLTDAFLVEDCSMMLLLKTESDDIDKSNSKN